MSSNDNIAINFLYKTLPGRAVLTLLVKTTVSKFAGWMLDRRVTRVFIRGFIKRNNIKMEEYRDVRYRSFNDFFIREIKDGYRPFPDNKRDVAAPCDGKLTAYQISADSIFHIKNSAYTVDDLLQDKELADEYMGGVCLIFRLTPDDYHRYSYIDDGEITRQKRIRGILHTVRPVSHQRYHVYSRNTREYAVLQTKNFGKVIQMEVGALFVGRITNYNTEKTFKRGGEKGMFEFGGSTIIMLFQKNSITLDDSIYENTRENRETIVKMGYKIGEKH
jgi:phosphatidylserine decarboxylase